MLEARDDVDVIGLDRDPEALHAVAQRLEHFGPRFRSTMRRFDDIDQGLAEHGVEALSGAIFDLGVSSYQLDEGSRGFSYCMTDLSTCGWVLMPTGPLTMS